MRGEGWGCDVCEGEEVSGMGVRGEGSKVLNTDKCE